MDKKQVKEIIDLLDMKMPMYFIDIDWKANKYVVKEVNEWDLVVNQKLEVSITNGSMTRVLNESVFVNSQECIEKVNWMNNYQLNYIKLKERRV